MKLPFKLTRQTIIIVFLCLAVLVLGGSYLFRSPNKDDLLSRVSAHIILPNGEPVIAEVTDVSKLQSSLKKVTQKGDYVLVYDKAQKVIIYRPSVNKVVDVQPILFGKQPNASLNVTVAIYNGSGSEDKLALFVSKLYALYPNVTLLVKETAPRTFPKTIVFTKEKDSALSQQIAEGLGIEAGNAPEGVSADGGQVTFVIGQDFKE